MSISQGCGRYIGDWSLELRPFSQMSCGNCAGDLLASCEAPVSLRADGLFTAHGGEDPGLWVHSRPGSGRGAAEGWTYQAREAWFCLTWHPDWLVECSPLFRAKQRVRKEWLIPKGSKGRPLWWWYSEKAVQRWRPYRGGAVIWVLRGEYAILYPSQLYHHHLVERLLAGWLLVRM